MRRDRGASLMLAAPGAPDRTVDLTGDMVSGWATAGVSCDFQQLGTRVRLASGSRPVSVADEGCATGNALPRGPR